MKYRTYLLGAMLMAIGANLTASVAGERPQHSIALGDFTASGSSSPQIASFNAKAVKQSTVAKSGPIALPDVNPDSASPTVLANRIAQKDSAAGMFKNLREMNSSAGTSIRWFAGASDRLSFANKDETQEPATVESPELVQMASHSVSQASTAIISDDFAAAPQSAPPRQQSFNGIPSPTNNTLIYAAQAQSTDGIVPQPVPSANDGYSDGAPPMTWAGDSGSGFCDDTCCGPGCGCVRCCPRRQRIIVAGTDAVFLSPDLNGRRSSFIFEDLVPPGEYYNYSPESSHVSHADIDNLYIAPRFWLGIQGCRWGIVGRYFHLRAGEHAHDPFIPFEDWEGYTDQGFDINSLFEAYYADLEVTRNFCLHGCKNQFSFGVRYALIEHDESIVAMSEVPEGLINGGARSNRKAFGTGITFGLNGRKPLFCNSCAHWFYSIRNSVVWGCVHNDVETWAEAVLLDPDADAIAGSKDGAYSAIDDDLFIGEIQLGLEWNFALRCLPAKSFFRVAAEYQYWDAGTGSAASGSFAGFGDPDATSVGTASADAPGLIADLYGFHVGTGFTW